VGVGAPLLSLSPSVHLEQPPPHLSLPLSPQEDLHALVFGESVLNDAVAVVLYRVLAANLDPARADLTPYGATVGMALSFAFIFVGSSVVGLVAAALAALLFKSGQFRARTGDRGGVVAELGLFSLFPYAAYSLADGLGLSGIVAILFCGLACARYTTRNLSHDAQEGAFALFGCLASLAETFIFVYMGLAFFVVEGFGWAHGGLFAVSLVACLLGRAAHVWPIVSAVNRSRAQARALGRRGTAGRIPPAHRDMLWLSGLRGGVAFALAAQSQRDIGGAAASAMTSVTLGVAAFTVLVVGGVSRTVVERLGLQGRAEDAPPGMPTAAGAKSDEVAATEGALDAGLWGEGGPLEGVGTVAKLAGRRAWGAGTWGANRATSALGLGAARTAIFGADGGPRGAGPSVELPTRVPRGGNCAAEDRSDGQAPTASSFPRADEHLGVTRQGTTPGAPVGLPPDPDEAADGKSSSPAVNADLVDVDLAPPSPPSASGVGGAGEGAAWASPAPALAAFKSIQSIQQRLPAPVASAAGALGRAAAAAATVARRAAADAAGRIPDFHEMEERYIAPSLLAGGGGEGMGEEEAAETGGAAGVAAEVNGAAQDAGRERDVTPPSPGRDDLWGAGGLPTGAGAAVVATGAGSDSEGARDDETGGGAEPP